MDVDIPDRMKDGYGISEELIDLAAQASVDTIITCDNGISAISQIAHAKACLLYTSPEQPQTPEQQPETEVPEEETPEQQPGETQKQERCV